MSKRGAIAWWSAVLAVIALLYLAGHDAARRAVTEFLVPSSRTWHDLLTAVGTCAAAGVALWLGLDARRRDANDRMEEARLVASEISGRLSDLLNQIASLDAMLTFSDSEYWRQNLKHVRDAVRGDRLIFFRRDTLVALIPLPNQAAHRIARAMDYLRLLRSRLDAHNRAIETGSDTMIKHLHKGTSDLIAQARDELKRAVAECGNAAALATPHIPDDTGWDDD